MVDMIKQRLAKAAFLISVIMPQASCLDREHTYSQLLGSWQGSTGPENSWCATYSGDGRYTLFSRMPIIDYESLSAQPHTNRAVDENSEPGGQPAPKKAASRELGVGLTAGYFWVARGGRFWQRGAVIRDNNGKEMPKKHRVLQHSGNYVIHFQDSETLLLQNIDIKSDNASLSRVASCAHFEKDVNMDFEEPIWDDEAAREPSQG